MIVPAVAMLIAGAIVPAVSQNASPQLAYEIDAGTCAPVYGEMVKLKPTLSARGNVASIDFAAREKKARSMISADMQDVSSVKGYFMRRLAQGFTTGKAASADTFKAYLRACDAHFSNKPVTDFGA
jgi:hypothetical protein